MIMNQISKERIIFLKKLFDEDKIDLEDMTIDEKKALINLYKINIKNISMELNNKLDYLISKQS